ncbi:NUDIX domain-containing protein [Metarhizium album ARSEF 1941]|uniref:NUDIX domain-containing protein n=1 Tax=Metarhizium album (strain ARSEF 1941) TaxID=1081103 RepID=A0A0B2WK65_METAS|nr:NUDIX domain-containing protein [Metarhizium album ARSEF 1941]KHN96451.1 NUDIX domain-containing protein [Metarhizium album ARSEF 1941]
MPVTATDQDSTAPPSSPPPPPPSSNSSSNTITTITASAAATATACTRATTPLSSSSSSSSSLVADADADPDTARDCFNLPRDRDRDSPALTDGDVAHLRHELELTRASAVGLALSRHDDTDAAALDARLNLDQQHLLARLVDAFEESLYYDASTMAGLNSFSLAALNRLRAYKPPPFPLWDTLPAPRRAAVLVLLYADRWGDLRVVITMRAASLRNFSGHAALPGGKADSRDETPYQIARREAFEEIGLPMDDALLPKPFRIEPLCHLPPSLARTHLVVTPCVAFLHADRTHPGSPGPLVEESLMPRLDAREVAAVFSAPFYNFLKARDLPPRPGQDLPPGTWYDGEWMSWKDVPWRIHNFYVPVNNQRVAKPRRTSAQGNMGEALEVQQEQEGRFKVWGMTGRLLVDAARIAYGEEPEMEHNDTHGDYDIILRAEEEGVFKDAAGVAKKGANEPAKM